MDRANPYNLTKKQFGFVAAYLGSCKGNATKAALEAGYSPKTAETIAAQNLRKRKIQDAIADWRNEVKTTSLRELDGRLAGYEDLADRLRHVIDARAVASADGPAGADSGLLVASTKVVTKTNIKGDQETVEIAEYAYDSAIVRDLTALYAQIAKETSGPSRLEVSGPNGGPVQISSDLMVDIVTNQLEHQDADKIEAVVTALDNLGVAMQP